jgi:hypothetical protein
LKHSKSKNWELNYIKLDKKRDFPALVCEVYEVLCPF